MPKPHALACTFDKAGNVGHNKGRTLGDSDHAEYRGKGGEMVVCDFRPRLTDHRNKGGFSHVWEADKASIGKKLKLKLHLFFLADHSAFGKTGSLAGGSGKMTVSPATSPAPCNHCRSIVRHVGKKPSAFGILNKGASGNTNYKIGTVFAETSFSASGLAVFGDVFPFIAKIRKGRKVVVGDKNDVSALSAVPSVGTAGRNIFLPPKGDGTVAAVPCADFDFCNIYKHFLFTFRAKQKGENTREPPFFRPKVYTTKIIVRQRKH